jgi:hypothetical protein
MTKRVQFSMVVAVLAITLAACNKGPLLGLVTETYVNQNNARQTLELTTKETLKGFIGGRSPNPGIYTLSDEQKVTMGAFTREANTYVFKSQENRESKIALQQDGSLLDESGNTWRLQERSRSFRPPEKVLAQRRIATAN